MDELREGTLLVPIEYDIEPLKASLSALAEAAAAARASLVEFAQVIEEILDLESFAVETLGVTRADIRRADALGVKLWNGRFLPWD